MPSGPWLTHTRVAAYSDLEQISVLGLTKSAYTVAVSRRRLRKQPRMIQCGPGCYLIPNLTKVLLTQPPTILIQLTLNTWLTLRDARVLRVAPLDFDSSDETTSP